MPKVTVTRTIDAAPDEVWETVGDAYALPRWWPRCARVEAVTERGFTEVLQTPKGRSIRADFTWADRREGELVAWDQDLAGTPFERVFKSSRTTITVAPEGTGSRVTFEVDQQLRGWARFSPWMVRSATKRVTAEAADGLADRHGRG